MVVDTVAVERGLKVEFNKAMTSMIDESGGAKAVETIATQVTSQGEDEKYGFLGDLPAVKTWAGDKTWGSLTDYSYTLTNEDYYNAIAIDRNELDDDRMGIIKPRIQMLVADCKSYKLDLLEALLENGATGTAYDSVAFFNAHSASTNDNTHVGLSSTAAAIRPFIYSARSTMLQYVSDTSAVMKLIMDVIVVPPELEGVMLEAVMSNAAPIASMSSGIFNPTKGWIKAVIVGTTLTNADAWFGLCTNKPLKPLIMQTRKEPTPVLDLTSVARNRTMVFSVEMRCKAGYGMPQMACMTEG